MATSSVGGNPEIMRGTLPIPDPKHVGSTTYDAKDPNTKYPPITMLRPPAGCAQHLDRVDPRRRSAVSSRSAARSNTPVAVVAGGQRGEAEPLPHHRPVLADPPGEPTGRTTTGGHGRDHRDGHLGAGQQQRTAQGQGGDRRNAESQRLFDRAVPQVSRGALRGRCRRSGPSISGRRARGSSTFTASSAARPTSTTPAWTRAPRRSNRRRRRRRATRSPRTSPTTRSPGCASRRHWRRTNPSWGFAPGANLRGTTCPSSGRTSTVDSSTRSGMRCGKNIFAKQQQLGVIPESAELTKRHAEIPGWDDMPDELKPVLARQMEIYAGFLEQTDHEVGRLIDAYRMISGSMTPALLHHRRQRGVGGGHAERLLQRDDHAQRHAGHRDHRVAEQDRRLRHSGCLQPLRGRLGAMALRTLNQWTKQIASHWGGTRTVCRTGPDGFTRKAPVPTSSTT